MLVVLSSPTLLLFTQQHRQQRSSATAAAAASPTRSLRRRQQRSSAAAAAATEPAAAADPLALQRAELGARVVLHVATGGERFPELRPAILQLPVLVEAPRAWHTLEACMASAGTRPPPRSQLAAALAPRRYPIPASLRHAAAADGGGCHRCQLACSQTGRRFRARPINLFLALLFQQVPSAVALAGLPAVQLDSYDLHHGHAFWAAGCGRLGLLLHAKEYPASEPTVFTANLGRCQHGSTLAYDEEGMRWRNLLWVAGRLACLDMAAPALAPLLMPGLELPRTVLEHDLGLPLADVNFLHHLAPGRKSAERLFVCVPGDEDAPM